MKSHVLLIVWCSISGEAGGEIRNWSLLRVKRLRAAHWFFVGLGFPFFILSHNYRTHNFFVHEFWAYKFRAHRFRAGFRVQGQKRRVRQQFERSHCSRGGACCDSAPGHVRGCWVVGVEKVRRRHRGNALFCPCGHFDFESAITAQNSEFKGSNVRGYRERWPMEVTSNTCREVPKCCVTTRGSDILSCLVFRFCCIAIIIRVIVNAGVVSSGSSDASAIRDNISGSSRTCTCCCCCCSRGHIVCWW